MRGHRGETGENEMSKEKEIFLLLFYTFLSVQIMIFF